MRNKKSINLLIKALIALLLAWAIYRQVFARQDAVSMWNSLVQHFVKPNIYWFFLVIALAPVNLAFESLKWRELIKGFSKMNFWRSYKAVLSGVTIAIFTPNRVGEYGGRILFVKPENNWKAVIATMVGSLAQLLVVLSFGLVGLGVFSVYMPESEVRGLALIYSLGGILIGGMFFTFFNIDLLIPVVKRLPFIHYLKRYFKHLLVLKNYTFRELLTALSYAFLRYATYSLQYYFLLKFYEIPVPLGIGLAGIATAFFVQASIPLPPVMGLLARGEIALFIWGFFSQNEVSILAATFSLFVINVAVPALIGMAFIVQANIVKTFGYENGSNQ